MHETYNTNSKIKFKTKMLKPSLYNYGDAYILAEWIVTITGAKRAGTEVATQIAKATDQKRYGSYGDKEIKNFAPFTDYVRGIDDTPVDNAKDLHIVMTIYDLMEHKNKYSKTCWSFYKIYMDQPGEGDNVVQS